MMKLSLALSGVAAVSAFSIPESLQTTTDFNGNVRMLIKLRPRADLSEVSTVSNQGKGEFVLDKLRNVANQSQTKVTGFLSDKREALGIEYIRSFYISNVIAVTAKPAVLDVLAAWDFNQGLIEKITPNFPFHVDLEEPEQHFAPSNDNDENEPEWHLDWVNAPEVWSMGYNGTGYTVGNADTGILWSHESIIDTYAGSENAHEYAWYDAVQEAVLPGEGPCGIASEEACDDNGHGSHTVSTSAGTHGIGVAPGAKWIGCRNMDRGFGSPSTYLGCLEFMLAPFDFQGGNPKPELRPVAVGNSYGCPTLEGCDEDTFTEAARNLRAAGVFMSVSAGNSGPSCGSIDAPPGTEPSVITVAASSYQSDDVTIFSSRGPSALDGSRSPDITAPGQNVRAAWNDGDTGYRTISGTSMASPAVNGAVALVVEACPHLEYDVDAVQDLLQSTATPLYSTTQTCGGDTPTTHPNHVYGYGQLDVLSAVRKCQAEA